MKLNTLTRTALLLCAGTFLLSADTSWAVLINITVKPDGTLMNTTGIAKDTEYANLHGLNPTNNNPDRNLAFLDALVLRYNGVIDPNLPDPSGPAALDPGPLNGVLSYTLESGYDYVVLHFGAGNAGGNKIPNPVPGARPNQIDNPNASNGWWQAYYLGGEGGQVLGLPQVAGRNVGGFSSALYFGETPDEKVPEGGATAALLGMALCGMGAARRFMSKKA